MAVDEFLQARWPGYRATLDRVLPGAFAQALADAGTWFEREASGQLAWRFGEAEVRRISQPTLSVLGGRATPAGPASARRTGCYWLGCRTPKGSSCPVRRTSCNLRTREAWPRR